MRGICATYVHTPPKLCAANTMTTPTQFSLLFIPSISFSNNASHRASGYFTPYSGLSVHHVLICNDIEQRATANRTHIWQSRRIGGKGRQMSTRALIVGGILAVDPWAPNIDSQSIASQLFAASLFPYLGFLYHITKSNSAPKLTLFGFYFLLAFVGATIPAGIYAKVHYGTSLSNVDWLHGSAESLLSLTNLFIVLGLRHALRREERRKINSDIDNEKSVEAKEQEETSV